MTVAQIHAQAVEIAQGLEELMALRREAIARNSLLTAQQEEELEQLVDAEVRAATDRARALFGDMAH